MKPIRVYVDTSVFGGVYDQEFADHSKVFFEQVRSNRFTVVTSVVVQEEIAGAPVDVRKLFDEVLSEADIAEVIQEAIDLRDCYLKHGIVSSRYADDALHVALATISACTLIVSWNFKHIVHFDKIPLYNAVNLTQGYKELAIFSPSEVIRYE